MNDNDDYVVIDDDYPQVRTYASEISKQNQLLHSLVEGLEKISRRIDVMEKDLNQLNRDLSSMQSGIKQHNEREFNREIRLFYFSKKKPIRFHPVQSFHPMMFSSSPPNTNSPFKFEK